MTARVPSRLSAACLLLALPTAPAAVTRPATSPNPRAALAELRRLDATVSTDANHEVIAVSFSCGSPARDADIALVRPFPRLAQVTIVAEQDVTDAGVERLKGLGVKRLSVFSEELTDRALEHIATMPDLETLQIRGSKFSGAEIAHLKKLPNLRVVRLHHSGLTDADLKHFAGFPALTELRVGSEKVTDAGLKAVRDALPKATVTR
jgi:hypothetical protein